jgi:type VI secretion system secreted protein Hcp
MAVDIYLTIPGILGESMAAGFVGSILAQSFSWGIGNPINPGSSGAGSGKAQFSDVSVVKNFDRASPLLMRALAEGIHLPKIVLSFVRTGRDNGIFLTYEFVTVFVTSLQDSASGELPTEALSFAYEEVIVTYHAQNPDGSAGQTETFAWDLRRNAAA